MEADFELPWPPTANLIWRRVGNVTCKSKAYREFLNRASVEIFRQDKPKKPTKDKVKVEIILFPPKNMRFDIDNRIKPILDCMTAAGVWEDDSLVYELRVRRDSVVKGGLAIVKVETLEEN